MKVWIVDDEAPARERLRRLVESIDGVELLGESANGLDALEATRTRRPDVVLLDIRMPGMDGLESARHWAQREAAPVVIFVTAYGDHAVAAFEAEALDYLLKPVRRERLEQALERVRRLRPEGAATVGAEGSDGAPRSHLLVQQQGRLEAIPVNTIRLLQAEQKYVVIHHADGEALTEESLKALEQAFAHHFVRIHRNALVARDELVGMSRGSDGHYRALLAHDEARPEISRRHVPAVRQLLREKGGT